MSAVELCAEHTVLEFWLAEAALLEALIGEDESAVVPGENFHPVTAAGQKDEQVPDVEVLLPPGAHDGTEPVDALSKVHRLGSEEDSNRWRQQQHGYCSEASSFAT